MWAIWQYAKHMNFANHWLKWKLTYWDLDPGDSRNQRCGSGSRIWDPGSEIRCLFDPWIRDPEWVFSGSRISDLGSRIPNPYFWELSDNFLGKKFYNSLKNWPKFFFFYISKVKCSSILWNLWLQKKGMTTNFFSTLSFIAVFGSGIRDPGSGIRDQRSGIRDQRSGIRDQRSGIRDPGWVKIRIRDPG